jgi:hypothetical protein
MTTTSSEGLRPRELHDIDVQPLGATQWRVCDRRVPPNDALSVLGFIEELSDHFEAMEICHKSDRAFAWYSFPTLDAATAHFCQRAARQ